MQTLASEEAGFSDRAAEPWLHHFFCVNYTTPGPTHEISIVLTQGFAGIQIVGQRLSETGQPGGQHDCHYRGLRKHRKRYG
jgi:hypothetical protein